TQQSSTLVIGLSLVLVGLGAGSFFAVQVVAAQNALPETQLGVGTGVIRYCMQLGQPLGAALMGIVVNGALAGNTGAFLSRSARAGRGTPERFLVGAGAQRTGPPYHLLPERRADEASGKGSCKAGEARRVVGFPVKLVQRSPPVSIAIPCL